MLTGDLADFSLREILQFLATTSASGVLELRSVESTAGVALHDGRICVALLDVNGVRGLAARLVRAGTVDTDRLRQVGRRHQIDAIACAAALGHDVNDVAATAEVYLEHTYEALGWLTRMDRATFAFERSTQLDDWPFDAAAVDDVFAVVDERAERWSALPDTVSDLTLVCSPRPDPSGTDEITLTVEQWRLIALVDGRRAVRDLIELSGIGYLETCVLLHELVTAGLVELVEPGASTSLATLLDGLHVEETASPAPPLGTATGPTDLPLDLHPSVVDGTDVAAADGQPETEPDGTVTSRWDGEPTGHDTAPAPPADAMPVQPQDADAGSDDDASDDANRTLLDRLIGGKGAAR